MIKIRAEMLLEKLLSFKFVIFAVATVLKIMNVIGGGEWLAVASIVLAGHEGQKGLSKFLEREEARSENDCGG